MRGKCGGGGGIEIGQQRTEEWIQARLMPYVQGLGAGEGERKRVPGGGNSMGEDPGTESPFAGQPVVQFDRRVEGELRSDHEAPHQPPQPPLPGSTVLCKSKPAPRCQKAGQGGLGRDTLGVCHRPSLPLGPGIRVGTDLVCLRHWGHTESEAPEAGGRSVKVPLSEPTHLPLSDGTLMLCTRLVSRPHPLVAALGCR